MLRAHAAAFGELDEALHECHALGNPIVLVGADGRLNQGLRERDNLFMRARVIATFNLLSEYMNSFSCIAYSTSETP